MKVGFLATVLEAGGMNFPQIVKWAGENAFECLEVDVKPAVSSRISLPGLVDPEEVLGEGPGTINKILKENNVFISSLFYYGANNLDPDLEMRKKVLAGLKRTIEAAVKLGVGIVVTAPGSPHRRPSWTINPWGIYYHSMPLSEGRANQDEAIEVFAEVYQPLAKFAEGNGVKIAFEPSSLGGGPGSLAFSPEMFDRVFEVVPSRNLGLAFDPSHLNWIGIDCIDFAKKYTKLGRVFTVHGKDNEVIISRLKQVGILGDGWWRHRLPGWGDIDWQKLVSTLKKEGYDYVINIEYEDRFFGFDFNMETGKQTVDIPVIKKGLKMSREYLLHAIEIAQL